MQQILVATSNQGKLAEVVAIMSGLPYEFVLPSDLGIVDFDPEEIAESFEAIARDKAQAYSQKAQLPAIADDSGLLVDALHGRPGIYSKRYADTDEERIQKLLEELKGIPEKERTARFKSAVCLFFPKNSNVLEAQGVVEGHIALEARGTQGFGYDPIFIPNEISDGKTFAELGSVVKNKISHRARALEKLKKALVSLT